MKSLRPVVLCLWVIFGLAAGLVGITEAKPNKLDSGSTVSPGGVLKVRSDPGDGRPPKVPPPYKRHSASTDSSNPASGV